ncbi:MAG: NAD-dependent epimerase/dehydratase family protein [Candidatus Kerfeldbacteria bacterium]
MNILVTGGAGFIGSHLVDALVKNGSHNVTVVDDLSYGHKEFLPKEAAFIKASITSTKIEKIIGKGKFDAIYHCAAQKGVRPSLENPLFDAEQNVIGLLRLMEAAHTHGVRSVVFTSSGGTVYGDAEQIPTPESAPLNPESPYAITKVAGEQYLKFYAKRYQMNCVSLRLANVYGPRQDPKGEAGVVAIFFNAVLNEQPITIFGDGKQTRDYIYVDDVISAFLAVQAKLEQGSVSGEYNVGTGVETDVNRIAAVVQEAVGATTELVYADAVPGEIRRSALLAGAFASDFAWKAETTVENGVKKSYQWFNEQHTAGS